MTENIGSKTDGRKNAGILNSILPNPEKCEIMVSEYDSESVTERIWI